MRKPRAMHSAKVMQPTHGHISSRSFTALRLCLFKSLGCVLAKKPLFETTVDMHPDLAVIEPLDMHDPEFGSDTPCVGVTARQTCEGELRADPFHEMRALMCLRSNRHQSDGHM